MMTEDIIYTGRPTYSQDIKVQKGKLGVECDQNGTGKELTNIFD